MKKSQLQQIIQEEIQKILAEESTVDLKLGEEYQIRDPGENKWKGDYEYLGFDLNLDKYMFRAAGNAGEFYFVGIPQSDLATDVK